MSKPRAPKTHILFASPHPAPDGTEHRFGWALLWDPRDLWIGCWWHRDATELAVYLCFIPTLSVLLRWTPGLEAAR